MRNGVAKGCCKDEQHTIKTDKDYQIAECCKAKFNLTKSTEFPKPNDLHYYTFYTSTPIQSGVKLIELFPDNPVPIYKLNCLYRI